MPIYEFQCEHCGNKIDIFLKVLNRNNPPNCNLCNCNTLKRVITFTKSASSPSLYPFTRNFGTKKVTINNSAEKLKLFRENNLYEMPTNYGVEGANLDEI